MLIISDLNMDKTPKTGQTMFKFHWISGFIQTYIYKDI